MGKTQYFRRFFISPIIAYRWFVRPMLKPCCRFEPSCSEYAIIAIQEYGVLRGFFLTLKRLVRCHPGCQGGFDPVLPKKEKS